MDNQHKKISGYRDLSQMEVDLMNKIKEKGSELESLIQQVHREVNPQDLPGFGNFRDWAADMDRAETNLKQGIMWLVRCVAKPEGF